jgi:hypothetical protein
MKKVASVEVKMPEFQKFVRLEYQEFDVTAFFEEILPYVRTPHKCYHLEGNEMDILLGVTHPITFKITADEQSLKEVETKLRAFGFKKAKWEMK